MNGATRRRGSVDPDVPDSMITHEAILAAASAESLLSMIASVPYEQTDQLADELADLHNDGRLDILEVFRSDELPSADPTFFRLQQAFCLTLPRIRCAVAEAAATCQVLFEKGGVDLAAGQVYDSLLNWLQLSPSRPDEGLSFVRSDLDKQTGITRHVLVAGATHDPEKYAEEALDLSRQPQPHIRQDALLALGRIAPEDGGSILDRITDRVDEVIESPESDHDAAIATRTALQLLDRFGERLVRVVEPLLIKACDKPKSVTRHAIAVGLHGGHGSYTEAMIDASFSAIRHVDRDAPATIQFIDVTLSQWDLAGDRQRVFRFLRQLLSNGDNAVDLEALDSFQHKLTNGPADLLGWYVVSLLLTGHHRLSLAARRLLPHEEVPTGLDIDLTEFALDSAWVPFLARKILGYCLAHKAGASALLLSCLRAVSDENRADLETLILSHFLLNYPGEIEWLEAAISANDPAEVSVKRLSSSLARYLEGLQRTGLCAAFQPNARELLLQAHRQADLARTIWKEAQQRSVMYQLVHRSVLLYGSASVYHVHADKGSDPQRQEMPLTSFNQEIDMPRLEALDPVGLQNAILSFRSEAPPK